MFSVLSILINLKQIHLIFVFLKNQRQQKKTHLTHLFFKKKSYFFLFT